MKSNFSSKNIYLCLLGSVVLREFSLYSDALLYMKHHMKDYKECVYFPFGEDDNAFRILEVVREEKLNYET